MRTSEPWGFAFEESCQFSSHGKQDRFVPFHHGDWLADHIPGVDAYLTEHDGRLTLTDRLAEIHQWLLDGFR